MPRPIKRRLPLVAIFISFRDLWGAVIRPPPGRAKVAQTVRGLKDCSEFNIFLNSYGLFYDAEILKKAWKGNKNVHLLFASKNYFNVKTFIIF